MRVAVVGGGVIGLACAYSLARRGAEVTLLEQDRCGAATSRGNTGWIVPGLSPPLQAPGVVGGALRGILASESPLRIKPTLDPRFLRWSWRFWRSCTPQQYVAGTRAMVALGARCFDLYDEMRAAGVAFELHSTGMVAAASTPEGVAEWRKMVEVSRACGYTGGCQVLDADEVRELEPALSGVVVGGVYAESERYVRPEELTAGLADHLRRAGVRIAEGVAVRRLSQVRGGSWWIDTPGESLEADAVVLAAGVWSRQLLAGLGRDLLLEAAKGYSVTATGSGTPPSHALYLCEPRVGCSTFGEEVRVAGVFDLTGLDLSLGEHRIASMMRTTLPFLADWRPRAVSLRWAGLRPYTPDGLPVIGPVPGFERLVVATGHGRMGITVAPSTGRGGRRPAPRRPHGRPDRAVRHRARPRLTRLRRSARDVQG